MEPAGMEPLGSERHGWADPRGWAFRVEGESSGCDMDGKPEGCFRGKKTSYAMAGGRASPAGEAS